MEQKIDLPHFEFTIGKDGEWTYKTKLPVLKHKPVHGEKPQFPVVEVLEEKYEQDLKKHLDLAVKDVRRYLNV